MPSIDVAGALVQLAGSVVDLPLAHPTDVPHQEVPPPPKGDGGANPVLVGGGIAGTLALAAGLIWVRQRSLRMDDSAPLEGNPDAERHEQGSGPAVEPGDHAGPRQEPA